MTAKPSICGEGALCKSGVYAGKVTSLTPGDLPDLLALASIPTPTGRGASRAERTAEVSRRHSRRCPAEGPNDERQGTVTMRDGNASDHLRKQAAAMPQDELAAGLSGQPESIQTQTLLAQVLDRVNLQRAALLSG